MTTATPLGDLSAARQAIEACPAPRVAGASLDDVAIATVASDPYAARQALDRRRIPSLVARTSTSPRKERTRPRGRNAQLHICLLDANASDNRTVDCVVFT